MSAECWVCCTCASGCAPAAVVMEGRGVLSLLNLPPARTSARTGREFVAGSYDRTVRIFAAAGGHSREVYHTKRMQRVFAVRFSGDGSYVFSGGFCV